MPVTRDESTACGAWVVAKLRAMFPTALIRPNGKKEADPVGRAIIYSMTPLNPSIDARGNTRLAKFAVTARVIDVGDSSWALGEDALKIHQALQGKQNEQAQGGYLVTSCYREGIFAPGPVVFKGVEHQQLGGTYRVSLQPEGS